MLYIVCSEFLKSKGLVRIGRTLNIEKRESQYKCSDPTYSVEYYRDVEDKMLTEKAIHYILNNIRKYSNREFFYCSSLDKMKGIVNRCMDLIEELIVDQEEITKEIRKKYMEGEITELIEEEEEETKDESKEKIIKRVRTKSPAKRSNQLVTFPINLIEETQIIQESLIETIEYNDDDESISSNQVVLYSGEMNKNTSKNITLDKHIYDNYKDCNDDDYERFATEMIIRQQQLKNIHNRFKEWCIRNKITNIPNEKSFMENIINHRCEIIKVDNREYIKRINKINKINNDDVETKLKNIFEFTNNDSDTVSVNEVNNLIRNYGISKVTLKLYFDKINIPDKKNRSNNHYYYHKLKLKQQV